MLAFIVVLFYLQIWQKGPHQVWMSASFSCFWLDYELTVTLTRVSKYELQHLKTFAVVLSKEELDSTCSAKHFMVWHQLKMLHLFGRFCASPTVRKIAWNVFALLDAVSLWQHQRYEGLFLHDAAHWLVHCWVPSSLCFNFQMGSQKI